MDATGGGSQPGTIPGTIPGTEPGIDPVVAVVIVSQGDRPNELARCLTSLREQRGLRLDIVVVGNGWDPVELGPDVRTHAIAENLGPPAARNVGLQLSDGAFVLFFDDDAWFSEPDVLCRTVAHFIRRPRLGALQLRVCDPLGATMRRWVPRARVGDARDSGPAFSLCEGVVMVRRRAITEIGGWAAEFFYGHEGIDLAWRMWDAEWELHYAGNLTARHPSTLPTRHSGFHRFNARNRVWTARRNLPALLVPVYLGSWTVITFTRLARQPKALRVWCAGFIEGWRTDPGRRHPMRWRTVARLTRLGQPPIL